MNDTTFTRRCGLSACLALLVATTGTFVPPARAASPASLPSASELRIAPALDLTGDLYKPANPVVAAPSLASLARGARPLMSTQFPAEVEPNNTPATATPIPGSGYVQIEGNIFPAADVDYFSFSAQAGDRVYAATITTANTSTSADSQLTLLASDGTTQIEFDDDDGSLANTSSTIANATIPVAGTYYLKVNHFNAANFLRPYLLHFRLLTGAPTPEVEGNDTPATANPLPANGWVSGTRNPAAATEQDWYSFTANAGDTVFLSLDVDPERDNVQWNGRLGIALFGDAGNQILVVDDASTGSATNPLSEALVMTVKTAGTYFAFVDSASAAVGGPTATYTLSVNVAPAPVQGVNCTTYTSTDVPTTIGPTPGLVSSTLTIPGTPRIADLDVEIQLNHALMADVDAHLRSPAGNDIGLFSDIGAAAIGGQQQMDIVFDDEAAAPPAFTVLKGLRVKPELNYRLNWFDGENAGGTWTLDLRDDTNNASGGTLTGWSLHVCEAPPPPTCAPGFATQTVYSTDFESGAAGFTHSGTADEWELGLPATLATTTTNPVAGFTTCGSGVNCWKTDLDNTYNVSSSQDLLSPAINLAGLSAPIVVNWSQQYQMESASFDHYNVDFRQVGGATPVRVFEWLDGTMTDAPGNPAVNIGASSGWSRMSARADALAGLNSELNFHLDSDNTINFGGVAVDDVSVTGCRALSADLSITKTDSVTTATPGGSVTYTITASNAGADPDTAATVADTFPASLTCTWTCVGAGGGTCTASGAGNINDTVNLPAGGSSTYTASCAISAAATGTLSNTATVAGSVSDPNPGNNSATDTDTLTPQADIAITKTDGVTSVLAGGSLLYTITTSNAGPSNATGATVADTFPASLTCTWTCVGAGGGTCTAAGTGNISDTVNLPAGGSTTHTASCTLSGAATGTLSNTATATAPGGVTDPTPGNNSATDTDTILVPALLSGTKTVSGAFTIGSNVTYTVTLNNGGGAQGDNPGNEFVDVLPASLQLVSATATSGTAVATIGTNTVSWNGAIAAAGSVTITITATILPAASGAIANQGSIAYDADGNGSNESSTVTDDPGTAPANDATVFIVVQAADLSITKTDGVTSATAGGSTTYAIVASNAGPSDAVGASVADTFPPGLTCTWTCAGALGGACSATGTGNIADSVNLPVGSSVAYTASCAISASASGSLVNTATVTAPAGVTETNPGNNSATDTDALGASADLSITKTDGVTTATPGGSVTYTITASNAGPSDAVGTSVADTFPASLTCTWTCAGASGGTCTASGSGNVADSANLPAGGSVAYTASCTIGASATGTLANTATVGAPGGVTDTNPANNSATDTDALGASADLSITKTDGVTTATPGGSVTYTITASNAGPSDAGGASVVDTFPAGLTCTWTCTGASGGTCTASGSGNIADSANLPSGGSATYIASCAISASASGSLVNTATVAASGGVTDTNPANNSATDTDALGASADLSISKTDGLTSVTAGTSSTYVIVVGNAGPSAVTGANVADTFPAECSAPSWTCAGTGGATCPAGASGNIAASVDLPVGGSATFTANCPVGAAVAGGTMIANTATVSAPAGVTDTNPANNSATDTTTVVAAAIGASISGSKSVIGSFVAGGNVVYTIVLGNAGGAQGDNPGDEFFDTLPAQLVLVSASASSGTVVANAGANTVAWNGAIAAGGSVTITVNATILATASGTVINQGTFTFDGDANGSNETIGTTDDPTIGGANDPTAFTIGGGGGNTIVAAPTLGPIGLALLALGLLVIAMRRRRYG